MRTIVLDQPGTFRRIERDPPAGPAVGEALVRVLRVGICGTDRHAYLGRQPFFSYPRVLGHELGVEIIEVGEGEHGLRPGDRCAVEPYLHCGLCQPCRRGKTNCCENLRVLGVHIDGGMQELLRVPVDKLHRSGNLSPEQLALVETLGIGAHACSRAAAGQGDRALVVGAGPIGLSVIQFASLAGCEVLALERDPRRRVFCERHFPVMHCLGGGEDAAAEVRETLDGELPELVFDATGSRESMRRSFGLVSGGGKLVLVGLVSGDISFDDPEFHRREVSLLASRNALGADLRSIIHAMEAGRIDVRPWITHRASHETVIEEFAGWLDPEAGVVKAVMSFT